MMAYTEGNHRHGLAMACLHRDSGSGSGSPGRHGHGVSEISEIPWTLSLASGLEISHSGPRQAPKLALAGRFLSIRAAASPSFTRYLKPASEKLQVEVILSY
jgi:hypothetical protein